MLTRSVVVQGAILAFCSVASIGQQKSPPPPSSPVLREFPVVLQQNVEAGKTPAGTKVKGKIAVATQFAGALIPKNAIASGVVVESEPKKGKTGARLSIRLISATWNGGWTPLGAYLMPLYYPTTEQAMPSLPTESPDPSSRNTDGPGQSSSPMSLPSPGNDPQARQGAIPSIPIMADHPVRMKDLNLAPTSDGGIALVSEHANIKLYKLTTYIFAADESSAK